MKNLFIFAALFFDFQFNFPTFFKALLVFVLFCLLTSGVYIFNDIYDLESDRLHPTKKNRPIASRIISVKKASIIGAVLIALSLGIVSCINVLLVYAFLAYLGINVLYNLFLKKIPIVDVLVISLGFIIRILIGSIATNIPASNWILIMTFILSIFLGISKRRSDFILSENTNIKPANIELFSLKMINNILLLISILLSVTYFLYTINDNVVERIGSPLIIITNVFVLLGVYRYFKLLKQHKGYKDPTGIVLSDWKLQLIITLWAFTFIIVRYV